MLAIIPHRALVKMLIPIVFERSLDDETSANRTYPSGPLFKGVITVKYLRRISKGGSHAGCKDKVVNDRLGAHRGQIYPWQGFAGKVTHKGRDGPLGFWVRIPNPNESNQEQDDGASNHAPVEDEPTAQAVDGVKGQQISDDLCARAVMQRSAGAYRINLPRWRSLPHRSRRHCSWQTRQARKSMYCIPRQISRLKTMSGH